jgi:hypothetical protein
MKRHKPIKTVDVLVAVGGDPKAEAEMLAGYWAGFGGAPEPGVGMSRAYHHGWRNGAVDGGHREPDAAQAQLASEYVAHARHSTLTRH